MKRFFILLTLLMSIVGGVKADVIATWDFHSSDGNYYTAGSAHVEGNSKTLNATASDGSTMTLTVDATTGKLYSRGGDAQFNSGCIIQVPVVNEGDIVTIISYPGYYNYTVGGVAASENETNHIATSAEASQGYVEVISTGDAYLYSITTTIKTAAESSFKDIRIDLTNSTFAGGVEQWTSISTGITVDNEGTVSRVATDDASSVGTIAGSWHGTQYGWANFTASIPVPGYVKITYGTNNYGSSVSVTNSAKTEVATLNNNDANIWSLQNPDNVVTAYYASSEPTTLNFSRCDYVGYFAVEKMTDEEIAALSNNYTLTYYDTDGTTVLGTQEVAANTAITVFSYSESNCTIASGKIFRGWFASASGGQKYTTSTIVSADMSLYAVATATEVASESETYTFDLTNRYFYAEDHEAFNPSAGSWNDGQHGWSFGNGNTINLLVGSKAIISIGICKYSASGSTIQVKKGDDVLATLDGQSATDGETVSFNYVGDAGTLTLNIVSGGSVYIHNVQIVNYGSANYTKNGQWYTVDAGSANGFVKALAMVNSTNGSASAPRSFIFLPNGTYNLGTATLTQISGHNISIIGESRDGVIIMNRPEAEGISVTATLKNTGTNNYLQDLTLDCIAPYANGAERGVCLQDAGNKTICKNVYLKGLQDSYYSNNTSGQFYFEDGKIEGTVDYICGHGDVYFNRTLLYNANSTNRSGGDVIAAPNTPHNFGYIFNNCTIDGEAGQAGIYQLGRPWAESGSKCLYVNTTMQKLPVAAGWAEWGTHTVAQYAEYKSVDGNGLAVDVTNRLTTIGGSANNPMIIAAEAATYMVDKVNWDNDWKPATLTVLMDAPTVSVDGTTASWDAVEGATAYALYKDGSLVGITTTNSYTVDGSGPYTLRVANSMGGFGDVTGTTPSMSPAIGTTGYATFSTSHALDFSNATGVKAYVATSMDGSGKVYMTKVTGSVPANTGLFLQKTEGDISIPVVPTASAPASNLLKASVYKTVVAATVANDTYRYVFAKQNGSVGFYNLAEATDVPTGKCYLETTSGLSLAHGLVMVFDDEEMTGIAEIQTMKNVGNEKFYNLNGQRVAQPTKGLYIVGGRKVMVK